MRLTNGEAEQVRRLARDGMRQVDIARKFGVSQGYISRVVNDERLCAKRHNIRCIRIGPVVDCRADAERDVQMEAGHA